MNFLHYYFYQPSFLHKILAFLLLPLSFVYLSLSLLSLFFQFLFKKQYDFKIPIISVGNLSVGGNGKTPMCKAIASFLSANESEIFVVLRGYKRKSRGLKCVKLHNEILCGVSESGDEAMEYAYEKAIKGVIVSEDRIKGIYKALECGARLILLDDAFTKFYIKKFDLLLESQIQPYFSFVLPSGAYRLPLIFRKKADFIALEGKDFHRFSYTKENQKALLITAIAKPFTLYEHFIKARKCYFFKDHYHFTQKELENLLKKHNCDTLMLTFKDFVKIKDFGFKCQIIELHLELSQSLKQSLLTYIKDFYEIDSNKKY